MTTQIIGTGSYLPQRVISNDDLTQYMDTSDEWIRSRTGIEKRHISEGETTIDLAVEAAKRALDCSDITNEQLELIIVASVSPDENVPSIACRVQERIAADRAVCFDLNAACSGFLFALSTAHAYITGGFYQNALIIGAETLSKIVDWTDRSTCVLFGDGAGAAIVQRSERGVEDFIMCSDGTKAEALVCKSRAIHNLLVKNDFPSYYVSMEGQEVFKFAVKKVPETISELLKRNRVTTEEIKYFVLHQANMRIIHSVAKRLKASMDKFPLNVSECGNTSAASVPLLLDKMNQEGMLQRGDRLILAGFGGGLTWCAMLLTW